MNPELVEANIEMTANIFQYIIDNCDDECKKMKQFAKFQEIFNNSETNIEDATNRYHTDMKLKNKEKNKIIVQCIEKLREAERKAERDSIAKIEEYLKFRKHEYRSIEQQKATDQEPDYDSSQERLEMKVKELQV